MVESRVPSPESRGFQLLQRLPEFVARIQPAQGLRVAFAQGQVARALVEFDVGLDGGELARQRQLRQRVAQVLAELALDVVGVCDDRIQ